MFDVFEKLPSGRWYRVPTSVSNYIFVVVEPFHEILTLLDHCSINSLQENETHISTELTQSIFVQDIVEFANFII